MGDQFIIATQDDFNPIHVVQLPSQHGTNKAVRMRRPDPVDLVMPDGDVPDVLTKIMQRVMDGKDPLADNPENPDENMRLIMESCRAVAVKAFVEPRLVYSEEPGPGEVNVKWLGFNDLMFVFSWALGLQQFDAAARFPEESAPGVPST